MLARILRPYFRWIAVVCLALLVFGLGYAGFREYYRGRPSRAFDRRHRLS